MITDDSKQKHTTEEYQGLWEKYKVTDDKDISQFVIELSDIIFDLEKPTGFIVNSNDLKYICDLTLELVKITAVDVPHVCVENLGPEIFNRFLLILDTKTYRGVAE